MRTSSVRIALLLKTAGFIDDNTWKKYQKKITGEGKKLGDILTSDALSLKTYKDLLTMEIKIPFGKSDREEIQLAMGQTVQLAYGEMQTILNVHRPELEPLVTMLLNQNIISEEVAEEAKGVIDRLGEDAYNALLERDMISPDMIAKLVEKGDNPVSVRNRVYQAVEILKYNKVLSTDQAQALLKEHAKGEQPLPKVLSEKVSLKPFDLIDQVMKGLYLPTVNLRQTEIGEKVLSTLPGRFIRRELFLPLTINEAQLFAAMADPLLSPLVDTVAILTGKTVLSYFAPQEEIMNKIAMVVKGEEQGGQPISPAVERTKVYGAPPVAEAIVEKKQIPVAEKATAPVSEPYLRRIQTLVDSQSTVQLTNSLIESAILTRATDIHLEPLRQDLRVRFRIDGKLQNIMRIPREMQLPLISRIKVLGNMDVTERRRPQDGHFGLSIQDNLFDFRISSLPITNGEKIVIRILERGTVLKGLSELGLDKDQEKILTTFIHKPYGMILVTGPTGSGKTTTLYSSLNLLNKTERNIVTIEDPVEYQIDGINQIQVDYNIDLTFASGLRSVLRQDPDIIMVGEIRDKETARIAVRSALTGHLVFSTLHANRTVSALNTLVQMGVSPFLTSSALIGIITQRLVRRICQKCKKPFKPEKGVLETLNLDPDEDYTFYHGEGCEHCLQTGYHGRTAVFEILVVDDDVRTMVTDNAPEHKIFNHVVDKGMTTLLQSGINKIKEGITTPQEVIENVFLI